MYEQSKILQNASSAMVYNPNELGAVESIVNKQNVMINCYENVFNAVNYNAKCDISNPCYTYDFVAKIINAYRQLVQAGTIQVYDRQYDPEEIANIENGVIEATGEDSGRVRAVLYELYFSIQRKETKIDCIDPTLNKSYSTLLYAAIIALSLGSGYFIYHKRHKKRK